MKQSSKNNLVCQYLENISRKALEKYQNIVKKYVKGRHGLYVLYRKNKLYYVGLASNLRNRLKHHLRDRHAGAWDSFSVYLTAGGQHLKELETLLLRIIDRKGNKQRGKFGKAEDLRKRLKNDFKKAMNNELKEIFGWDNQTEKENIEKFKKKKGRIPVLAPFVDHRFHIQFKYKGKLYIAHVKHDGTISFAKNSADAKRLQGKVYTSPSKAASVAVGKPMNGWKTWRYERAPGDWVLLDELRK
jgi:hypothetical protein